MDNRPYVISPDEFGECLEYEQITLTYYADDVLADDRDEIVDRRVVGLDALSHIGDYEPDAVHIRNDILKTEYEILVDHRKYSDVIQKGPRRMED